MSWFSGITDFLGITTKAQVGSPLSSTSPTYGASVINPSFVTTATQAAGATLLSVPAVAETVVSGAISGAKAVGNLAANIFKSLTPVQKAVSVVAAPVVASAVINSPKLQNAIAKAPSSLVNFGGNVGKLVENPSIANTKQLISENPILSTVIGGAAVAAIGGGIGLAANTAATFLNSKATKENTMGSMPTTTDLSAMPSTVAMQPSELSPSKSLTPSPAEASTASLVAQPQKSMTTTKRRKRKSLPRYKYQTQPQVLNRITNIIGING